MSDLYSCALMDAGLTKTLILPGNPLSWLDAIEGGEVHYWPPQYVLDLILKGFLCTMLVH